MSDPLGLALTILALLLGASIVTACCAGRTFKRAAHWPLIVACGSSAVLALMLLARVAALETPSLVSDPVTWFAAGKLSVNFTIALDPLSCIMLAMVTFIATWIAIFSSGYMHGDGGYVRYFAVMSLFVFSMCGLVLANNFFLLLAFWEGVGLCSYLLVGYYFEKPSAAAAARKAFLVTRLGDTGLIIGVFMLWRLTGFATTDIATAFDIITKTVTDHPERLNELTIALLCLFCGAVGKSAQFPLYVWLPDAMEGPTPVSALIHAATMVTAGVYLVARCAPLFALSPTAQITVAWIGGITAILAAFIAMAQTDLKRVLAYSTVSQLGYMFLALGTIGAVAPAYAVTAALFHLFTHAFFKALLFLSAGSVMHAMGNVIDMRRFGGLRKVMPVTHITFLCGAAALAGVPLLSGFWSKDMVFESLYLGAEGNSPHTGSLFILLLVGLVTAGMTAFYTFRAYFLTFWGEVRIPEEAGHHAHESPSAMTIPLIVLAIGAVGIGAIVEPITHAFSDFLARTPRLVGAEEVHGFNWGLAGVSALLALGGIAIAYMCYGKGGPEVVPAPLEPFYAASRDKLYVDEVYSYSFVKPAEWLAFMARVFDLLLDSLARLVSAVPRLFGAAVRPIQNGLVQFYALSMALGLVVFLTFIVLKIAR